MSVALLISSRGSRGPLKHLAQGRDISKVIELRRQKLSKALEEVHSAVLKGDIHTLVFDRLELPGISTRRVVREFRLWAEMGVDITIADGPDLDLAGGAALLRWIDDHFERERIAAIKRGMSAAGSRPGRPRVNIPKDQVLEMYRAGRSLKAIARATGVSVSSIGRFLRAADSAGMK